MLDQVMARRADRFAEMKRQRQRNVEEAAGEDADGGARETPQRMVLSDERGFGEKGTSIGR